MAVVVFVIWVLFLWCLETNRRSLAGFVLALCLFKPTLVALPALMLLVGRRWRVVGGLAAGGVAMAGLSVWTVGLEGCRTWLTALLMNGHVVSGPGEAWHLSKYVDLLAFSHLVLGNQPLLVASVVIALGIAAVGWLGRAWWRSDGSTDRALWAATLCFTLVVNPYAPIYDSILVVAAVALVAADRQMPSVWLLLLYMIPWVTQSFAEFLHLQLSTVAVAGFGVWAIEKAVKHECKPM